MAITTQPITFTPDDLPPARLPENITVGGVGLTLIPAGNDTWGVLMGADAIYIGDLRCGLPTASSWVAVFRQATNPPFSDRIGALVWLLHLHYLRHLEQAIPPELVAFFKTRPLSEFRLPSADAIHAPEALPPTHVTREHIVMYAAGELPSHWLASTDLTVTDDLLSDIAEAHLIRKTREALDCLFYMFAARLGYGPKTDSTGWAADPSAEEWRQEQGRVLLRAARDK